MALHDLNLTAALHDRLPTLALTGRGQHKGKPVVLDVQVGAAGEQEPNAVYAIDARIELGQTRLPRPAASASRINCKASTFDSS